MNKRNVVSLGLLLIISCIGGVHAMSVPPLLSVGVHEEHVFQPDRWKPLITGNIANDIKTCCKKLQAKFFYADVKSIRASVTIAHLVATRRDWFPRNPEVAKECLQLLLHKVVDDSTVSSEKSVNYTGAHSAVYVYEAHKVSEYAQYAVYLLFKVMNPQDVTDCLERGPVEACLRLESQQ